VSAPTQGLDGPISERAVRPASAAGERTEFDLDMPWRLHPQVAVRPESFGALLYHFGTRKLSFLKNRTILTVVQSLDNQPDVRAALRAAGVEDSQQDPYVHALGVLAGSQMLVPAEEEQRK
jgi:putative mycofactocin binding protein MftB